MALDESKLKVMRFESELEGALKRFDACQYALAASKQLKAALANSETMYSRWRPHHLMHSIEACCAYHRRGRADAITTGRLARVMNVYHDHPDQYVDYLLAVEQKLGLPFRVMYAEQIRFQEKPRETDFGRCYLLFVKNSPLPETTKWLLAKYGLSPDDWFTVAVGATTLVVTNDVPIVRPDALEAYEGWNVTREAIDAFISLSSRTPEEVREQYHAERNAIDKWYLRGLVPSGFHKRPLLQAAESAYLAPLPSLLAHHLSSGLYELCRGYGPFGRELGDSFENYVQSVLEILAPGRVIPPKDIENAVTGGKHCDFIADLPDANLLVECKATSMAVKILTEENIATDTATRMVVNGIDQHLSTAAAIRRGELDHLLTSKDKPLLGIVTTYGRIPMANIPWYRGLIEEKLREAVGLPDDWPKPFEGWPQILHVADLEELVRAHRVLNESVLSIIATKESQDPHAVGDWDTYLPKVLAGHDVKPFPLTHNGTDEFFETIIPPEELGKWRQETGGDA